MGQDGQGILLLKNVKKFFAFTFFEVLLFMHIVGNRSGYECKTLSTGLLYCFSRNSHKCVHGVRLIAPPYRGPAGSMAPWLSLNASMPPVLRLNVRSPVSQTRNENQSKAPSVCFIKGVENA